MPPEIHIVPGQDLPEAEMTTFSTRIWSLGRANTLRSVPRNTASSTTCRDTPSHENGVERTLPRSGTPDARSRNLLAKSNYRYARPARGVKCTSSPSSDLDPVSAIIIPRRLSYRTVAQNRNEEISISAEHSRLLQHRISAPSESVPNCVCKLAEKYKWEGRCGKQPLRKLELIKVIFSCILQNIPNADQGKIQKRIMEWFRHSKARHFNEQKLCKAFRHKISQQNNIG
ncbi:hypothetical protein PUN28_000511 [Cardiocondyla obscurior]|uniref:Uncharacterized protein n=1 Tax=Cardiocondyla obscurior TaxID=286306 RepID=A0AAW2GZW8_9HYME